MSPDRLSNLTIVFVEDHDDARRYLGLFLNQIGADVVLARNAFEGLETTKKTDGIWWCPTLKCRKWTASSCCVKFVPLDPITAAVYRLSL